MAGKPCVDKEAQPESKAAAAAKMMQKKPPTENDLLKYEVADELGLLDKVLASGWKSLTARESGQIGGFMAKRKKAAPPLPHAGA